MTLCFDFDRDDISDSIQSNNSEIVTCSQASDQTNDILFQLNLQKTKGKSIFAIHDGG